MKPIKEMFADWVETMPPEEEYDFLNGSMCAFAQFEKALGCYRGPRTAMRYTPACLVLPSEFVEPLATEPWTFGALAQRLAP